MVNPYTLHIANVQKKTDIVATGDICNKSGQLIVRKGTILDSSSMDKIIKFKLLKPLDQCVAIKNELTSERLEDKLNEFLSQDPVFEELHSLADINTIMHECCVMYVAFPILRQKMTVMQIELPKPFELALFSAWMSILICKNMGKNSSYIKQAFLVALIHDIGLLHISPSVFNNEGNLNLKELKQIHVHPVVGKKIIEGIPGIPAALGYAILEHHENLDGTGYPAAKSDGEYNEFGRLVHLLDTIHGIYTHQLKPAGRTLCSVLPILQMSFHLKKRPEFSAITKIIKNSSCSVPQELSVDYVTKIIAKIHRGYDFIRRFLDTKNDIVDTLGQKHANPRLLALQNGYLQIISMMNESGLTNDAYIRWLDHVEKEKVSNAYIEVEEAFFMLKEIIYQVRRIKNQAVMLFEDSKNTSFLNLIPDIMKKINIDDDPGID